VVKSVTTSPLRATIR